MQLQDKISKQLDAGFSVAEIRANLLADGYSREEIESGMAHIPQEIAADGGSVSPWRIVWTIVVIILALLRIIRLFERNSTMGFVALVVVVGTVIGVYQFLNRRR